MGIVGKANAATSSNGIGISEMSHGFDANGINEYLEQIKAIVLTEAIDALKDTSEIKKAVEANWNGKSASDFLIQLNKSVNHVAEQYESLYQILTREITNIGRKMTGFDNNLIGGE